MSRSRWLLPFTILLFIIVLLAALQWTPDREGDHEQGDPPSQNRDDPAALREDSPAPSGDRIVIDKSENVLRLYKKGRLVAAYDVATGLEPHFTPEGIFTIANKIREPGGSTPEESPLGARWIGLAVPNEEDQRGPPGDERAPQGLKYGIHGTNEPESIGRHASKGCIRMRNEDVKELFEQVEEGMIVEIRP